MIGAKINEFVSHDERKKMIRMIDPFFPDLGIVIYYGADNVSKLGYRCSISSAISGEDSSDTLVLHKKEDVWHGAHLNAEEGLSFRIYTEKEVKDLGPIFWIKNV